MLTLVSRVRARRAAHVDDAGVTLIELVVAMVLATIVATLAMMLFVTSSNVNAKTTNSNVSTASARALLDSWATLLRAVDAPTIPYANNVPQAPNASQTPAAGSTANRFINVTPTEITFWADLNNRATSCSGSCTARTAATYVDLSYNSATGALVETRYVPNSTTVIATQRTVIASGVSLNGWLFTPYLSSPYGGCIAGVVCKPRMCNGNAGICLPSTPVTGSALDPAAYLAQINRIDISFAVTPGATASATATPTATATSTATATTTPASVTYSTTVSISEAT